MAAVRLPFRFDQDDLRGAGFWDAERRRSRSIDKSNRFENLHLDCWFGSVVDRHIAQAVDLGFAEWIVWNASVISTLGFAEWIDLMSTPHHIL